MDRPRHTAAHRAVFALPAALGLAVPATRDRKKRRCPDGEARGPQGFPSRCCAAGAACFDTSRLGCCPV